MRENEGEWQLAGRRRINKRLTHSFFITGFPESTTAEELWRTAKHLGEMSDAYIAAKRRFNNDRFGFLRFKNVPRPNTGGNGKFGLKSGNSFSSVVKPMVADRQNLKPMETGLSFKDAFLGRNGTNTAQNLEKGTTSSKWKNISIPDEAETYPSSFYGRTLLGEAIDGPSLCSVKLLHNEGGESDFDVVYVGGLHVLLVFNHTLKAEEFRVSKELWWKKYFTSLSLWEGQVFPRLRLVGLKILGVPLHLRDDITYDEIAKGFGRIIWPSHSSWMLEDCSGGSVHILSDSWRTIEETILITWKESSYTVIVKEDHTPWIPSFVEEDVIPTANSSPEIQENDGFWEDGELREEGAAEETTDLQGLGGGAFLGQRDDGSLLGADNFEQLQKVRAQEETLGCTDLDVNGDKFKERCVQQDIDGGPDISGGLFILEDGPDEMLAQSAPIPILPDLNGSICSDPFSQQEYPISLPSVPKVQNKKRNIHQGKNSNHILHGGGRKFFWNSISKGKGTASKALSSIGSMRSSTRGQSQAHSSDSNTAALDEEVSSTINVGQCVGIDFAGCEEQVEEVIRGTGAHIFH
ncbi:hypothetical protein SSX86_003158 [Deinandra increscens subsp. villosa]|uniref:RRM domain-containing protein n=1 Tax=Deinandra increscens subsp. villosa TaxID=3103831 RepID=A0AAP0DH45_9ASTR